MTQGFCIYCNQSTMLEEREGETQEELNKRATRLCKCKDATLERENEATIHTAEENIERLFRNEYPQVEEILKTIMKYIQSDDVEKVTINIDGEVKAIISKTAKGKVKITKAESSQIALES